MSGRPRPLDFASVDRLAFAAARKRLAAALAAAPEGYAAEELGPLMEMLQAMHGEEGAGAISGAVSPHGPLAALFRKLRSESRSWVCPDGGLVGFYRATEGENPDGEAWTSFLLAARRATTRAGLPSREGAQIVAAMRELRGNIDEHSEAAGTGLVAFRGGPQGRFEFVAADRGVGLLKSLRKSEEYAALRSHAEALRLALEEGESRKGRGRGHGNGFRPIFSGLADMSGHLRFRSGDHVLVVDGRFELVSASVDQKAPLRGFLAAVSCRL